MGFVELGIDFVKFIAFQSQGLMVLIMTELLYLWVIFWLFFIFFFNLIYALKHTGIKLAVTCLESIGLHWTVMLGSLVVMEE